MNTESHPWKNDGWLPQFHAECDACGLPHEPMERLLDWLSIDSTTGAEAAFLTALQIDLQGAGLHTSRQEVAANRWNLWALPDDPAEVLLCTHVDTVPPHFGPSFLDGALLARGACDTKGGLAAMWIAWQRLPDDVRRKTGFLLVVGEEVDHIGALTASPALPDSLRAIVLCEPTQNRLARGQKGIVKVRLRARGVAGHSAFPETGESAIHRLVQACDRLLSEVWPVDPTLGPTTLNIGTFQGGLAANVFAPEAEAEVLFRAVTPAHGLWHQVCQVVGAEVDCQNECQNDPARLLTFAGFETDVVPFNTDAPYLQARGVPVVLVGPGDIRCAHSPREHIYLTDLARGVDIYVRIVTGIVRRDLGAT
jgi:acetylornithine deacetylase